MSTGVPEVKVNTSADAESKSHIHMGPVCNSSAVMSF